MRDRYLPSSTNCGKTCGSGLSAEAQGDARMGGEQATQESGNACAPAVAQQDVSDDPRSSPWCALTWIAASLLGVLAVETWFAVWLIRCFKAAAC